MVQWPSADDAAVYVPRPDEQHSIDEDEQRTRTAIARVRDGLPVTDEVMAALSPGEWLTPAEREDVYGDSERVEMAEHVLADAADLFTDIAVCWLEGRRAVRVFLTDELDHYGRLLADALGFERVVVEQARFSRRQREELAERVRAAADELGRQGIHLSVFGPGLDGFGISYFAADPDFARRTLIEEFGPSLTLNHLGASRLHLRAQEFGSWLTEGTRLHVFYGLGRNGERPGTCTASESDTEVIVDLTILDWRGPKTLVGDFIPSQASVELEREIGDRLIIDNAANRARPHWTQVERVPRPDLL